MVNVTSTNKNEITFVAVGDVVISRDMPETAFAEVIGELRSGDFSSCNFEVPVSNKGTPQYGKFEVLHSAPEMIEGFVYANFKVVGLANNHTMDYGPQGLIDTIDAIKSRGILYSGAGKNLEEARRPAFFECKGNRFAFLSFATEAFFGYGAHSHKPGIAMIRRDPLYGSTCVNPEDLEEFSRTIKEARKSADFVIASIHWGLSQSRALTQSQVTVGRVAVNAGAGIVIGHHPHILQAVEIYKESVIFYSLGNFVFDLAPDFFSQATRDTLLVKLKISDGKVKEIILKPVYINDKGNPEVVGKDSPKSSEILHTVINLSKDRKTIIGVKGGNGFVKVK